MTNDCFNVISRVQILRQMSKPSVLKNCRPEMENGSAKNLTLTLFDTLRDKRVTLPLQGKSIIYK